MPAPSLVIVPPAIARERSSSADAATVLAMSGQVTDDNWVTDGVEYKTYQEASNASQIYRRALAKAVNLGSHQIKTRAWGVGPKDVILTAADKDKSGKWYFALAIDRNRQKREKRSKTQS